MNCVGDASRKTSQRPRDTMERGVQAAQGTARGAEQSFTAGLENGRNLTIKLIDMAQANVEEAFAVARDIASVKAPPELLGVLFDHATRQIEMVISQTADLAALGQRLATETATPMTRTFQQAFTT